MPIKNYTTKVDLYQSLGEIQGALARNGACKIMVDYDNGGRPVALTFGLYTHTQQGVIGYHLPVNIDGVLAALARGKVKADREQAERTAWRNIRDWVMAQMAFVESGNVQMDEVFLPYMADRSGRTLYQAYKSGQLALTDGGANNG